MKNETSYSLIFNNNGMIFGKKKEIFTDAKINRIQMIRLSKEIKKITGVSISREDLEMYDKNIKLCMNI